MNNYWIVNFIFNFIMYSLVCVVFLVAAIFVFDILMFSQTSMALTVVTFAGWGLAQISWAFFFSVFLNNS